MRLHITLQILLEYEVKNILAESLAFWCRGDKLCEAYVRCEIGEVGCLEVYLLRLRSTKFGLKNKNRAAKLS